MSVSHIRIWLWYTKLCLEVVHSQMYGALEMICYASLLIITLREAPKISVMLSSSSLVALRAKVVVPVRNPFMSEIDQYKKLFVFDGTARKIS